jgi:hypothetical protein
MIEYHRHTGLDSPPVDFADLENKRLYIHHTIIGADAATAANYGVFWIAPFPCVVVGAKEVHQTAGTDAGTVSLQLEKLTGTQALDAGVTVLGTAWSLKATANSVQTATITPTIANRQLATGNRLALKDSGVLTALVNVTVLIEILY